VAHALPASRRLLMASLIDSTGTGFYLAISAIFLTRSAGLTLNQVGLALATAGIVAFAGSVRVGRLGDRYGHRRVLFALHLLRGAAFVVLVVGGALPVTLAMLSVIALADQAAASMNQALAYGLAGPDERVALMARMSVVTNIGIALGTVPAGIVLAADSNSFSPLLLANAASYVVAAAIIATLPREPTTHQAATRRRRLVPSAPTTALISIDGLMSMWSVVLSIGLPLWLVQATSASPALVAVLYATNTVLAILLQTRVGRKVNTYLGAAYAQRLAGVSLAACSVCLAASAFGGRVLTSIVLMLAVLFLTVGELLKISAGWQISFTLAPAGRSAEFFATYSLGRVACQVCGPVLITTVVLALGSRGWLLLAALFVLGAVISPPMARRAQHRPVVAGDPPADGPTYAPFTARLA
jgi:hypothetical protein